MSIVLFGPPGAGKGTQSAMLIEKAGKKHISTGDLFRYAMKNDTPLGVEAKGYVNKGQLVPDTITIGLVKEVLENAKTEDYIFDGFPRNEKQAEALEDLVQGMGAQPITKALFLEVPQEVLMGRLTGRRLCRNCGAVYHVEHNPTSKEDVCDKCGGEVYQRKDDGVDVISTRLQAYEESTSPLKTYYQQKGIFVAVDGIGSANEVFDRIQGQL